jgi:hypothetical protein
MQQHYSTVSADEMRQNLAKVVSLAGFREALGQTSGGAIGGTPSAMQPSGENAPVNQTPSEKGTKARTR